MHATDSALTIHQLTSSRQQTILFENLSASLEAGDLLVLEGPNGSGKSTLLRILAGLSTPLEGDVRWQQTSIFSDTQFYTANMHYVGHQNGIKLGLTAHENLQLMIQLGGSMICTNSILTQLGLSDQQETLARHLSAGQKRRLALAKLICIPKQLWLLDEPLTAIDVTTQTLFISALQTHLLHGGIAIVSTHQQLPLTHPATRTLRLPLC